uniref:Ubiquitin specific peptidase 40 n=1 Tax=Lepisosteus oculatus TaxID=7918 RepID=W5MVH3_LEPOC
MFGNLFEEDDAAFVPQSTSSDGRKCQGKNSEPPPPRGMVNLSGIRNQGGTCYLNSLLQTLLFTPEFREVLFSLGPEELGYLSDKDKPEAKVRVIPLELQRLFAYLLLVDQQAASTADLTDSFGWTSNEETSQQDVQELNRILFSALESSLVGTSGSDIISRLYHGTVVNQIVCKECGNVSERQEDILDLTVSVKGLSGLLEALWSMFVEEEFFEGNNLYRCSCCGNLVTAAKSAKLRKLPPFLTISLLRFSFDFTKCERYKETGRYTFPVRMNLRPFCEQAERADSEYEYELFSVIIHKGGCYGGHYHVYIKDLDQLGNWESPEEEAKPKLPKKDVKAPDSELEVEDPLAVLKAILSQEESKTILVDQLGQKLLDKIGVSWNKKFRKQHGPIGKFLQSHADVFLLVSNGTQVQLKPNGLEAVEPSQKADPVTPERTEVPVPGDEHHWFDLNDTSVQPIREQDIEKQFQGKESAYMLFYRKAELRRPAEARKNPRYKVPVHLLQETEEENKKLQRMRSEFEESSNTIEVRLHLAPHYKVENGALHPSSSPQDSVLPLAFDRRKTVGDLRQAIYQVRVHSWEGDMALTVVKSLPAGLHLYDTLIDDQQSLYSSGIADGMDLFVWNGQEVGGVNVQTGADWEPVLLNLVRPSVGGEDPGLSEAPQGFSGGLELGAVRQALGKEELLLCQEEKGLGTHGSGWRVFPPADMHKTIKELALRDGDSILVLEPQALDLSQFTLNGDIVAVTTPSECRWLQVAPWTGEAAGEGDGKAVKVPASGDMLLSEVKLKAMEELCLQDQLLGSECCLRQADNSGKLLPPVREDMSIREAGVKLMSTLSLCPGPAPGPHQLFLYFTVGTDPPAGPEMEIIVEDTVTVKECLKLMLKRAGLEGECWHLRKVDWCYEIGEPLNEEDTTLAKLKVRSGDTLVVTEGRLPPKGFLRLPVWLYGEPSISLSQQDPQINHVAEQIGELSLGTSTAESNLNYALELHLQFMGLVEISGEASLEDLKMQVMTLPNFQNLCVPSSEFLRVWVLEGKRPAKILRGNQQPINTLKLGSGTEICVQRLCKEENLGVNTIVLYVKMGVPAQRQYYPAEELVWDTAKECTARALRQAIASHYALPLDKVEVAKYFPDKYEWMVVSSWSQQVSKRKKKKKLENLLGAPFHLKDGDVIGVKNLLIDQNKDFSTLRDDIGKQQLRQEVENKRNSGKRVSFQNAEPYPERKPSGRNRKPEVALSINVGVFR